MIKKESFLDNLGLRQVLLIALAPRLLAAVFSQGYGMSDDHFLVIEVAKAWTKGIDIANWFVSASEEMDTGRGILYPGLHYVLFSILDFLGIERLSTQMYFVRLFHAAYSLLPVLFVYKLVEFFSEKKYAVIASLVMALLWFVPYHSIRNLVEMVAIVPLMWAAWISIKSIDAGKSPQIHLWVGLLFALSFSIRYQTVLFPIGFCLALLIQKHYREFLYALIAGTLWILLFHGLGDYLASGSPFRKVIFYINYNLQFGATYISQPWYQYIIVTVGFLVPPLGIFWFLGSFNFKRSMLPIFLGVLVFFAVHSAFGGKQERFIFTILPFVLVLGIPGWYGLIKRWNKRWLVSFTKYSWYFAITLNMIALVALSLWFSKSGKVKIMDYLYEKPGLTEVNVLRITGEGESLFPRAYSGQFPEIKHYTPEMLSDEQTLAVIQKSGMLIIERKPSDSRETYPPEVTNSGMKLEYVKSFTNSLMDGLHYNANPRNVSNFEYDVFVVNP